MNISINPLQNAYIKNQISVKDFFKYPIQPDWEKLCQNVIERYQHKEFLDILIQQNSNIDEPVLQKNLNNFKQPNTVVLITGQQLGLFVSPMYTIYKTLTTILMSEKLNREYKNYQFVPVFWLEGEDHDYDEINHAQYFDRNGGVFTVDHPEDEKDVGMSISKRRISKAIEEMLKTIKSEFQDTEFSESLFKKLGEYYKEKTFWTKAFSDQIRDIFDGSGLLLYNPADPEVKKYCIDFFKELTVKNNELISAFGDQTEKITKSGFEPQVPFDDGKSYIFISENDGPRQHLLKNGEDKYYFKDGRSDFSVDSIIDMLKDHPQWFSSTVLTRPVWQSWMLPVVSYIAGPAEIAYWAQLRPAFELLNVEMPHLTPRLTMTLLEPKIQRLLKKYDINTDDIHPDKDHFVREQIKRLQLSDLENDFKTIQQKIGESEKQIRESVLDIDPTLENLVTKTFENAASTISKLENRILKRLEEKNKLIVNHLHEIHSHIFPDNHLQERYIGSLYFLNKYGPGLIEKITSSVDSEKLSHQIIEL